MPGEIFVNGAWLNAASLKEAFVGGVWRTPLSVEVYSGGAWRVLWTPPVAPPPGATLANFAAVDASYCEITNPDPQVPDAGSPVYRVSLSWENPQAEAVSIFRNGALLLTTGAGAVGYMDTAVDAGTYSYSIQGASSGISLGPVSVTILNPC